jgi:hypothetical protein
MSDHLDDEGRDVRVALGGLLTDEPTQSWSVQDDVRRGQALRSRRRTRALGAVGAVAALALVAAVVGPLRPGGRQETAAAGPPAVQGLDPAWLSSLSQAFTDTVGLAVDWSGTSVRVATSGALAVDAVLTDPAYAVSDGTSSTPAPAGRALVSWSPVGGTGRVLAQCTPPACARTTSDFPGYTEVVGRWSADGTQDQGTVVIDRTYGDGGTLEIAVVPLRHSESERGSVTPAQIHAILDQVGRPPVVTLEGLDTEAVSTALEVAGWRVDDVAVVRTGGNGPDVTKFSVSKDDGAQKASLTVRTWDKGSWLRGGPAALPGSVLVACADDGACPTVESSLVDCAASPCWSGRAATLAAASGASPAGTRVVMGYEESDALAVELVATPTTPGGRAFLSDAELTALLGLVEEQLAGVPPAATVAPSAARACTSGQVKLIAEPDAASTPASVTTVRIRVIPRNPDVACVLQGTPQVTLLDADGTALGYRQVVGSTGDPVRIANGVEGSFRVSRTLCASAGTDVATLRVGLPGGGAPADVSVVAFSPLVSCATASPDNDILVSPFEQG